ncbi:S-methyl-5-thioribose kinase [Bacillus sp. ISL-47]|uniref:S-methyl-5-thioribose kinase n=1 Tax=Bacillus sp. ISL-47 TaxID=2819130 RepID=UPI001BE7F877|nr:S-methyl-5-thioribose kinase [Bacillus sp. ISL-47]MBT2687466.1 S-methyl-5-thioribose kinase [Bacillus sp. ISL-47]MBT2711007.1 S-methyl-5-thioribose kinase [Pseudomonas sp. ISL-84]
MTVFTSAYFTMNEQEAIEYAKTRLDFFAPDAELECREIGDGNLNYVFKLIDHKNNKSLIIKQAGPVARISDEFKLSPDRNRIEFEILERQNKLAPGFVPKVYHYDPIMNCTAMEDLSDHMIMRTALMQHRKFPLFADHISTFLVNTLLLTSDVVMGHKEKKALVQKFTNPELCEISEDLVFTEPFYNCPRNEVFEGTRAYAEQEIWSDPKLQLETVKLKFEFMSNAQSLLHGDLHTGSIFIKEDSTKIIDPEFAFYGPAGYDIGNVLANLIFAYVNAKYTIADEDLRADQEAYLQNTIEDIVDLFKDKFMKAWDEKATEQTARYDGFKEYYLDTVLRDTAAVAGLELCRRIIGLASVKDVTSIEDPNSRAAAEKICLAAGKMFIMDRESFKTGADFAGALKSCEKRF